MSQILQSSHQDYIHDIAFDHYGRRIATCSGDRTVKIWDCDENSEWTSSNEGSIPDAHKTGVTSISWAHPEFGQLLATSGSDGFAAIWEERAEGSSAGGFNVNHANVPSAGSSSSAGGDSNTGTATNNNTNTNTASRWMERARLTDSRKSLSCAKFAPRHLRLQLATGSADGFVRIYEAVDVMNLNFWSLKSHPINVDSNSNNSSENASDLGVTCLDWCGGRFEPPTLVVGDSSGNVNVYRYFDKSEDWGLLLKLDGHMDPRRGVLDVAWSPDVGRSFHLVASCGRDGVLRVHRLKKSADGRGSLELESSQELDSGADTWRCAWNVTGTVLASSGDGGVVKLWKSNFKGIWSCVSDISGNNPNVVGPSSASSGGMQMAP
mmetsp:Transcript_13581/g.19776  ORF Transcript_13581/g.19776 Transcript_13581/m.19776 type:complete len:379 (+) Transcript_13581:62-1198(+)